MGTAPLSMAENGERDSRPGAMLEHVFGEIAPMTGRMPTTKHYVCDWIDSPVGRLKLVASDDGLAAVLWQNDRPHRVRLAIEGTADDHPVLRESGRQLSEYFAGTRKAFDLPLDPAGTPFQHAVWRA